MFEDIVYGSQYYRAPTPLSNDWKRDIENIKSNGFNTIKIWAQWRSNCPAENKYDFSDLRSIMDIAHENGIKVIINIILDVAPAWFCKKYPDSVMIDGAGKKISYRTIAYRQVGGSPGPCFHFPEGIRARRDFCEALSKELGSHPALLLWDLWNEPELGSGIENREPGQEELLCYCEHSLAAFKEWLKNKYKTVEALNNSWHQYYGSWDEAELPRCSQMFNNMVDFREFFSDTLIEETRMRKEAVRKYDSEHPVMVHTVPLPYFNMVAACSDDFRLAQLGDIHGNSLGTNTFSATISVSAAEGKPVISSEVQINGGNIYGRPGISTIKDYKRNVFIPLSKGVKGFQYWQYRPERLGAESPAWGLTNVDGTPANQLQYAVQLNNALQENRDVILSAVPDKPKIAVINGSENQVFTWCITGSTEMYYLSLKGIFDALHDENYNVDIVSTEQLTQEKLSQYKAVFYPFPHYIKNDVAERLKKWVADGGTLVGECFFGAVTSGDGLFAETVPSLGFDEVFGAKEGQVLTSSVFHDPYHDEWSSEDIKNSAVSLNLGGEKTINGYYYSEELIPQGNAQTIAYFSDGRCAAVRNNYGKGSAVILGSLVGYGYSKGFSGETAAFFDDIIQQCGVEKNALCNVDNIRTDILKTNGEIRLIVVTNNNDEDAEVNVKLNLAENCVLKNILTKEKAVYDGVSVSVKIDANDCDAFLVCKGDEM